MYKVKWDIENNGVVLDNKISDMEAIVPPRPVFFEELNLLGFKSHTDRFTEPQPDWMSARRISAIPDYSEVQEALCGISESE